MRILIQPPDPNAEAHLFGDEVRRALDVLSRAYVKTEGGGTVTGIDGITGIIMLTNAADRSNAIAILAEAGIRASIG
jgi:hypothetical protein